MAEFEDYRPLLFGGAVWYEALQEPAQDSDVPSAWGMAKLPDGEWWVQLFSAAAQFAVDHGLVDHYRTKFRGIPPAEIGAAKAAAEYRSVSAPIWEITNELVVARYLERVHSWRFVAHEPPGRQSYRGDWEFVTPTGRPVFVEVKSILQPDWPSSGAHNRPDYFPRIRNVLRGAYRQLPDDGRATLVVLVGHGEMLKIPFDVMHGDLFGALFGRIQIRFPIGAPFDSSAVSIGPAFRDMFVQQTKHRRLGCVAGMAVRGLDTPGLSFYAIHNPFAHEGQRLATHDLADAKQFIWTEGRGELLDGITSETAWTRMATYAFER